jgi:type I restriction-modification system DNA methylase subunit
MDEREREEYIKRQHKKYTVLLQEHGRVLQEYNELEQEVDELDRERNALKEQMKNMLAKIGFAVTPEFAEKLEQC